MIVSTSRGVDAGRLTLGRVVTDRIRASFFGSLTPDLRNVELEQ